MTRSDATTLPQLPEILAKKADARALEIFETEACYDRSFRECLGMIWIMGIRAGYEAATKR